MAFENKKVCITGHTKGVGKAIKERLEANHYTVVGGSRSNGVNVGKHN
jgi:short-subunit dehydrogenase